MGDSSDIGHDPAAWAEGRFVAAVWAQTTTDLAVRTGFTLPISVKELVTAETDQARAWTLQAEEMYKVTRTVSEGMRTSMTRQFSYWVGYHNELQKLSCLAYAWVESGKVADDAQKVVAQALEDAQAHLLAQQGDA